MRSEKNIILKTSLITLAILIVVLIIISSLVAIFVPSKMANICYEIGFNNLSQKLFYKDYEKSRNINSLYSSLSINLETNNNKNVVARFEELSDLDGYVDFVLNYDEGILNSNKPMLLKGSLYNLDNYLNQKYVESRLRIKNNDLDIFKYSTGKFYAIKENISFDSQGSYLFSAFLTDSFIEIFANEFDKEFNGENVFEEMVAYFNNLNSFIESNIDTNVNKALIISFANRIIEVGNDIIKINGYLNKLTTNDIELIMDKIINVKNTYISGIFNG